MLQFSRAQTAAILLTVLVICSFLVPNFLSDETVRNWPESLRTWAQRRLVLDPGGASLVLKVDRNDLRAQVLTLLRRDVIDALHEAHIGLKRPVALRGGSIEVRPQEASFQAGLAKLRELSQAIVAPSSVDVVDAGGGLIRVTPTDAEMTEREQQSVDWTIPIVQRRMSELGLPGGYAVWQEGAGRIALQMPGVTNPQILLP
jgi:preprotein translocase subunit SecD